MEKQSNKSRLFRNKLKVLHDKYIVKTSENYKGLSYSDIIIRWQRWLLSDKPDQQQYGDILFLRGSVGYHRSTSTYMYSSFEIPQRTAILVPIVTTHYNLGDSYQGLVIGDEFSLRKAVKEHVDAAGPFWATMEINDKCTVRLVSNLEDFRVESMLFELDVSQGNPFLDKMGEPVAPGIYTALVAGYFVILRDLPKSKYRIRFGGYGMNKFYTESLSEINIKPKKLASKDTSGPKLTPGHILKEEKNPVTK
jgi:hypothetical protein